MTRPPIPLDAFDLEEEVGSGASGRVWRATHRETGVDGPQVAVKILSAQHARSERWVAAFRREVQAVAALDHPNVVRVYDHGRVPATSPFRPEDGVEPGSPYLAMEFLGGGTLTSRAGRLYWADLKAVLLTVLDALAHAHARGVLHRDIKPSNLLLGPGGVTLTDFGLGYVLTRDNPDSDRMLGTPAYMAPEQFQCQWRDFGPWTDLYSLGCTAYALSCALPPFGARQSVEDSMHGHLFSPPPTLDPPNPVPEHFEAWIHRLMKKSPENRFRCAADAAWALSALKLPKGSPEALRAPSAELSALGFSTLDLPSEVPTDLLSSYRFSLAKQEALPEEKEDVPSFAPPCPDHWRRTKDHVQAPRLRGVGLGLYGLRSIPLVGREQERTELWSALREVHREGRIRVCVLSGAGGSGKSRLARWICERAHEAGAARVMRAFHSATPGPGDGLSAMVSRHLGCSDLERRGTLGRVRQTFDEEFTLSEEEAQALTEFISPATDAARQQGLDAVRFESPAERNAILERLLRREANERPVILWLDDVHWGMDSLFFVLHLLAAEKPIPALIVLTCRSDLLVDQAAESDLLEQIRDMDETTRLQIGPLDRDARPALVRELLGLKGELAERVEERTAGNPLFAVQLVGDWVQRGILVPSPRGFEVKSGSSLRLPDTVHQVWNDRIQRVLAQRSEHEEEALELAAMLGQRVDWGEWKTACQLRGARASLDLVEELVRWRLAELPRSPAGETGWAFVHGMLRESLKRRSWEAGRAEALHRICAETLKGRLGADTATRHAHHLLAAGELRDAIEALARTAVTLIETGELRRASQMLDERDGALDRLGVEADSPERAEGVLLRSYRASSAKELALGAELAVQAQELARALGDDALRARALRAQGAALGNLGRLTEAQGILQEAGELASRVGDTRTLAASKRGRGSALTQLGDHAGARDDLEQALAIYRTLGEGYGITVCLLSLAREAVYVEDYERCRRLADEGLKSARLLGFRSLVVDCLNQLGESTRGQGDLESAERYYSQAIRRARLLPTYPWVGIVEGNLGLILAELERWEEALAVFRDAQASLHRNGAKVQSALVATFLLPCLAGMGMWGEWEDHFSDALEQLNEIGTIEPDLAKTSYRAAQLAWEAGRLPEAREALALATRQWEALGNEARLEDAQALRALLDS